MNLNEIIDLFKKYEEPLGRLTTLFVSKIGTRYKASKPQVSFEVQKKIVNLFKVNLENKVQGGLFEVYFNASGHEPKQYSICTFDYVGNYDEVTTLFDSQTETLTPDQISFIIYRLRINNDNDPTEYLYLFRKNYKLKSIRKGFG